MKHRATKLSRGLYEYRSILIVFDETQSELCWYIEVNGQREYLRTRLECQRQIDRYHWELVELTAAPTNAQLAKTDLTDYLSADLLQALQHSLAAQGLGRSMAQIIQAATNGSDGPVKRIMLSLILSKLLNL